MEQTVEETDLTSCCEIGGGGEGDPEGIEYPGNESGTEGRNSDGRLHFTANKIIHRSSYNCINAEFISFSSPYTMFVFWTPSSSPSFPSFISIHRLCFRRNRSLAASTNPHLHGLLLKALTLTLVTLTLARLLLCP